MVSHTEGQRENAQREDAEKVSRRHALGRLAQYTAPVVVAVLLSEQAMAQSSRG